MKTKPLDCKDIKELFGAACKGTLGYCCMDCHENPKVHSHKKGKLRNGWSYDVCCEMKRNILVKRL